MPKVNPNPPQFKNLEEIRARFAETVPNSILTHCSDQALVYTVLAWKSALSIETKTGLRHSGGSVLKTVNRYFGTNFGTKKRALAYLEEVTKVITDPIIADPA